MRRPTIDQGASVTAAIVALAGVFNVAARVGLTGDDLMIVIGALGTIASAIRHRFERGRSVLA